MLPWMTSPKHAKRIILSAHNAGAKLASADGIKSSFIAASERMSLDTKPVVDREQVHPRRGRAVRHGR